MCDRHDQLIGYVYDECDPAERDAIRRHIDQCADCRRDVGSLRAVREDLLSWDVPDHESVWRPFAPVAPKPWWQMMPKWAMVATGSLMLVSGLTGGALSHVLLADGSKPALAGPASQTPQLTAADLAAAEARVLAQLHAELEVLSGRVQLTSGAASSASLNAALHKTFDRQLAELQMKTNEQLEAIRMVNANLGQYQKTFDVRQQTLKQRVDNLTLALEQGRQ